MRIGMCRGKYRLYLHYYWVKKTLEELGHELVYNLDKDLTFTFGTEACRGGTIKGVPSAYWTVSAPSFPRTRGRSATKYDVFFIASRDYLEDYKKYNKDTYLLLPAADPEIYKPTKSKEIYDIGFSGDLKGKRHHLLRMLRSKGFKIRMNESRRHNSPTHLLSFEEINKFYSECKLVFNYTRINKGASMNMRVFEALSMGKCLLTNKVLSEPNATFDNRKHLVVYNNEKDLIKLTQYYLDNTKERKRIGLEGRKEILKKHTWKKRMQEMINTIVKVCGIHD